MAKTLCKTKKNNKIKTDKSFICKSCNLYSDKKKKLCKPKKNK